MISSYLTDRITIVKWNGYDTRNEPLPKTNVTTRGYVEWKTSLVRDLLGENVTAPIKAYLHMRKTDAALGRALCHEDRIIVDGIERPIIAIHEPKAFNLPQYEIFLAYGATRNTV